MLTYFQATQTKINSDDRTMSMKQIQPRLFFICDLCDYTEEPSLVQSVLIATDKFGPLDTPQHCGADMRLSVVETEVDVLYQVDVSSLEVSLLHTVKYLLSSKLIEEVDRLDNLFIDNYTSHSDPVPELQILSIYQAIMTSIQQFEVSDLVHHVQTVLTSTIEISLKSAKDRVAEGQSGMGLSQPVLPGSMKTHFIEFFCAVCNEQIEVTDELQQKILNDEVVLPIHHDTPVLLKIKKVQSTQLSNPVKKSDQSTFNFFEGSNIEEMDITSVGIDVGSSTTHLIFSQLHLRREVGFLNMTNRFNITDRKVLFESAIINTPLTDPTHIDIDAVVKFLQSQYQKAGITPADIDTGAVIVTGETAKKENASEIVQRLSDDAGKFVSAVAGPNLESMLAAMGSGASHRSKSNGNTVLNVDIGGGTSNLAVVYQGNVVDTSCVNVGGRLLGVDVDGKIWRIDPPVQYLMDLRDMSYEIGDLISQDDVEYIVDQLYSILVEVMTGVATSAEAKHLLMTNDVDYSRYKIDEIVFSGGVAELIFEAPSSINPYQDIGYLLAQKLRDHEFDVPVEEPSQKIRATVIGTGSYSLSISGSTISYDKSVNLPLTNIPALVVDIDKRNFSREHTINAIQAAFKRFDMSEGEDVVALYFTDPIYARDMFLEEFVLAIEESLPQTITSRQLIIFVFNSDIAGTFGMALKNQTKLTQHFICLDEISLEDGDWIDIGRPIRDVFPVIVKSLVFNN